MKKLNVKKIVDTTKNKVVEYSPEILTGIGLAGMISTTVLAVRATPKALRLIEEAKIESNVSELTTTETVKATWKCYIPAVVTGTVSMACIIGARSIDSRRGAALTAAYTLSEAALKEYKSKVVEVIGEKKEQSIRDEIAKDRINRNPVSKTEVFITEKGDTLCFDVLSGRYFKSDIDKIRKIINDLNYRLNYEMYISLNDFYDELGLSQVKLGNELGWNVDAGLINVSFSSQLNEEDKPCLVIDYNVAPRYNYKELH